MIGSLPLGDCLDTFRVRIAGWWCSQKPDDVRVRLPAFIEAKIPLDGSGVDTFAL